MTKEEFIRTVQSCGYGTKTGAKKYVELNPKEDYSMNDLIVLHEEIWENDILMCHGNPDDLVKAVFGEFNVIEVESEEVIDRGLEYPLFVYWRNPYANAIDKESPLTVPVFAECIEELRWLDIALNKMGDEQEDSQHVTFVSQMVIQYANQNGIKLPRFVQGLEMGVNADGTIQEHVPTMLVAERTSAINFYLSIIGYKCGFSNGYFSFDETRGIQTATQVESDDRRTLHTIESFRTILDGKNHDGVIHRILYILYATGTANGTITA